MKDHSTPDDKVFAIARRKAIQEVMRDQYLAPTERNARLQQILTGIASSTEGNTTSMPPLGLSNSSVQSEESIAERKRKAIRAIMQNKSLTSSQRNDEIQKIMKQSLDTKSEDITQNHDVYFSTIHSENRGGGLEERIRKKSNAMSNEVDGGDKSQLAFIPSSFVSSQMKLIEERCQSSAKQSSSRRLDDFEERIRIKNNAHEENENQKCPEISLSAIVLEDFEQRIKEKSANTSGKRGTMRPTSSSMASVDSGMETFEARIREKITQPGATNSANDDTKLNEKLHTGEGVRISVEKSASCRRLDEFEEHVRNKTATYNAASHEIRIGPEKSSPVKAMEEFEKRITAKAASSIKGEKCPTSSSPSSVDSKMDDFHAIIREKTARANSSESTHDHANMQAKLQKSSSSQSLEDFEKRLMDKTRENQNGLNRWFSSWRLKSFDQRMVAESTNSDAVNSRRPMSTSMSSFQSDSATFESRLLEKAHIANHDSLQIFASRALDKNQFARRNSPPEAQSEVVGTLKSGNSDLPPDVTMTTIPVQTISTGDSDRDKSDLPQAKRRAIRELMQDGSLTPQERNLRMQQIIAGDVLSFQATDNGRNESDATQAKMSAIRELMEDKSLTSQERNLRMQQIMRGNLAPLTMSSSDLEVNANVEIYGTSLIKEALDAKIAAKLKKKLQSELSCNEEPEHHPDDAEIANTMIECANRHVFVGVTNTSALEQSWIPSEDGHFGMSYSSLLRPEEQVSETFSSLRQSYGTAPNVEAQGTGGQELAVATAVEGEDEPDYVYAAIEYDPNSKPPLHKHRRFRIYTFVALLVITVSIIVMAMYITKVSKADKIVNITYNLTNRPTLSPTPSPTSLREASGILEQLEAGVLRRDETFDAMEAGDPRLLALDWILHRDGMQLVSDDVNLYQRFVLAVFAYSLDSFAWYSCGKLGENFTVNIEEDVEKFPENVCPVWNPYINRTETFGVWLSSTPECTWFGITCSDDGVVKGIELMYNDLIGQIPHELFALDFLTYLGMTCCRRIFSKFLRSNSSKSHSYSLAGKLSLWNHPTRDREPSPFAQLGNPLKRFELFYSI